MLIFTSGTSGRPKAVRITHEKVTYPGQYLSERFGLTADDVHYVAMPLFHSNAVMAGWAPALVNGAPVALREKFSATEFLADVRRFGATYASYVGKPLTYVLATPERPDDSENTLRLLFGNEAGDRDTRAFAERFGCKVVDGFGSTENAVIVSKIPGTPAGSLGQPFDGVAVLDPDTGQECPRAELDANGCVVNLDECVGELVNTTGAGQFAGYYNDDEAMAERMRGRDVLVRRPRLPRLRRVGVLRRTHRRLAPRRRREPRVCPDRAGAAPPPRDRPGGRLRSTRRALR